ncbi:retrovirus-related pol polyprotein from transposon TNT 1-94 [Tanacetum coccineum]
MDLFGLSIVRSYGRNRYTLVIVDDYSGYTWTRFLKDKTEAFDQFKIFSKKIQNQLGCTIVSIRTDHGREFDNEVQFGEFCNANGITHNFSAPRTPQSNGVVERKNRTLQEMSRTMLNEQSLPQKFWCDTSTYILNRIQIRAILGKTSYELLRGRKPTLDYFRVFRSKCFILNTKDYLTKFDPKSYECVFLGYSQNSKAYIILNKQTRKIKESLNVTFNETPPPSKTSPLVDDDLDDEEEIKVTKKKILQNDIEDETLEIDEIVNIKESRNHPLENVIGNLNQRTLRLVAQGCNQQEGIDYDETYAPVARLESIRILLAYACALDFKLFKMDVKSAFLNDFINEEVYVAQPLGFIDFEKPDHVYKLKKALYGLKQASKACLKLALLCLAKPAFASFSIQATLCHSITSLPLFKSHNYHTSPSHSSSSLSSSLSSSMSCSNPPPNLSWKPIILVRQVWRRTTLIPNSPHSSQNASPSLPPRVNPQSPSPLFHNPLRDQMINRLHNISSILESQTQNSPNAYSYAPPSPPSPLIHPPTNAQVKFHSSFCHCCRMRIEQYIQMIDYALWEVIENGATLPKTTTVEGVVTVMPITTAEEKAQRRLEVKARSTLMMGIPNEHQLKFNSIKDAKKLLEAVEKRFGGNAATKKTQRNLLKQQYENFTTLSSEMLDQTFDRLQKLVSQLELLDEKLSQEDVNQKLLRSLSPEWNTHVVVWRNKADLDTMSMDMIPTSPQVSTTSTQVNAANTTNIDHFSDAVICAFFASQPNSPQLIHEDLQQIHPDDMEEIDLRWQIAMLTHKARMILKILRRKLTFNAMRLLVLISKKWSATIATRGDILLRISDQAEEGPNYALMAFSSSNFDSEKGLGYENYNAVPPPYTRNFMPPTPDLSFTSLDEFVNEPVVENCKAMSSEEEPKVVRKNDDSPIIEEWVLDDEEEDVSQPKIEKKTVRPSIVKKEFVKSKQQEKTARKTVKQVEHHRQNTQRPRGNQRNWNNMMSYLSKTANSTVKRPIHKNTAFKNSNINQTINTVRGKNVNTARPKAVVNVVQGNNVNVVKASACWVWKPNTKVLDHGNPQIDLQDQGVIDSGCSKPMTRNMSYLIDYEEIDGGYVSFRGNPKGWKITRKCTIKTDHLCKFVRKVIKGFFIGYSLNSKAFRVVESELGFRILIHNKNNEVYKPIVAGYTQSNGFEVQKQIDDGKKVDEDPRKENEYNDQEKEDNVNSTNNVNVASTKEVNVVGAQISIELPVDPNMPALEYYKIFDLSSDDQNDGAEADINILEYNNQIEEEVYVCQPSGFEDPDFPDRVYKVKKALYGLHQALRAWYETLSTYLLDNGFQRGNINKTLFVKRHKVKTASTPIETQKPLLKDEDGEEVDVHIYRSMIGSLMYLTSSRPDIMFAVYACTRYQVNPKVSHLHVVKRIFNDYAGESLDRKSTTGGCQFLRCRLRSWQCKKQTMVSNSITDYEYVAFSSCCGQVLWIQNQCWDLRFDDYKTTYA